MEHDRHGADLRLRALVLMPMACLLVVVGIVIVIVVVIVVVVGHGYVVFRDTNCWMSRIRSRELDGRERLFMEEPLPL